MTRVWLTPWEWACCGDPFEIGGEVDFGIRSRDPEGLVDELGAELAGTVDALESHHEEEHADRVRGRVIAVHEVSREVVERRFEQFVDPFARARTSGRLQLPKWRVRGGEILPARVQHRTGAWHDPAVVRRRITGRGRRVSRAVDPTR
ncbi:DUF6578 domain-containing protein [Microbacterium oxydans]|uniref:DUF6578 domain-containing protein n=1 Tax=Microbacterium oxydans TaxID=82380 RepID=UPI00366F6BC7